MTTDLNTLICLFHHKNQAQAALEDVLKAGVPEANTTVIGLEGSNIQASETTLAELNVPKKDIAHLLDGLRDGGAILSVQAISELADKVEAIFHTHSASKIDEADIDDDMSDRALPVAAAAALPLAGAAAGQTAIPIVEEEMSVGKRTVDAGGVKVYRRIVEIPVEESVTLREEHAVVERRPVDRAVTDADLSNAGDRTIVLTETAEEAVVGKSARVVEEVIVGKEGVDRTEHIHDTVRRTEVEVEEIASTDGYTDTTRTR